LLANTLTEFTPDLRKVTFIRKANLPPAHSDMCLIQ